MVPTSTPTSLNRRVRLFIPWTDSVDSIRLKKENTDRFHPLGEGIIRARIRLHMRSLAGGYDGLRAKVLPKNQFTMTDGARWAGIA